MLSDNYIQIVRPYSPDANQLQRVSFIFVKSNS